MSTLAAIRDGIKTTLEANISGLRVHDTIPDQVNPPAVVNTPIDWDFVVAMGRGVDTWTFELLVLVARPSLRSGQDALDAYITGAGSSSIRQAIFNNRTLGLTNTDAHIAGKGSGPYAATYTVNGVEYLGATLRLIVHTSGTE